jgi:hypothetical protein
MKAKTIIAMGVASLAAWTVTARPTVMVQIGVPAPPPPVVVVPAPAVTVDVVPDYYVWDGVEYVGVVGSTYYYLGPDNEWIVCDSRRLARFHAWERIHSDWRAHETANVKYREDAHGHFVPIRHDNDRDNHGFDHGKDQDHGHDHGH